MAPIMLLMPLCPLCLSLPMQSFFSIIYLIMPLHFSYMTLTLSQRAVISHGQALLDKPSHSFPFSVPQHGTNDQLIKSSFVHQTFPFSIHNHQSGLFTHSGLLEPFPTIKDPFPQINQSTRFAMQVAVHTACLLCLLLCILLCLIAVHTACLLCILLCI